MTPATPRSDKDDKDGPAATEKCQGSGTTASASSVPSGKKEKGSSGATGTRRVSDRSESRLDVSGTSARKDKGKAALPANGPAARLCHMVQQPDFDGYGFTLAADEQLRLPTVIDVEEGSPAEAAGLRANDRIVEVNGSNVVGVSHRDVVERIQSLPNETRLLVVDDSTAAWYMEHGIAICGNLPNIVRISSARPITARAENKSQTKAEGASADPLAPSDASKKAVAPGTQYSTQRLSICDGVANGVKPPLCKEAKPSKEPKLPAKPAKPPGAAGSTATPPKRDGEPRRNQAGAPSLVGSQRVLDRPTGETATSSGQQSVYHGEASNSTRYSRSQVRWAPPSLSSPASPPYSSQGNDYEWYLDAEMGEYLLPDGQYPWAAPFMPPRGGVLPPTYASSAFLPQLGASSFSHPYAVFTPYQGPYWYPQMPFHPMPYQAPYAPVMPVPYYGCTSTFAPGYSDFSLYPGYASYEPLQRASASAEPREQRVDERDTAHTAPPDAKPSSSAMSAGRSAAGTSSKQKSKADGTKDSLPADKIGPKRAGGGAPARF